ncbi:MAG: hypothetical protein R2801_10950 [Chitinophagales bacterium]
MKIPKCCILPKTVLENLYIEFITTIDARIFKEDLEDFVVGFIALQRDDAETRYLDLLDKPIFIAKYSAEIFSIFIGSNANFFK